MCGIAGFLNDDPARPADLGLLRRMNNTLVHRGPDGEGFFTDGPLGMAMRRTIKRGRVIIPGHAKVGPPGTSIDLIYGPLDEGWDLDAFDSTPVLIHDAPRPDEIVLWIGYGTGPRVNARCKGPDQKEVDALITSFNKT